MIKSIQKSTDQSVSPVKLTCELTSLPIIFSFQEILAPGRRDVFFFSSKGGTFCSVIIYFRGDHVKLPACSPCTSLQDYFRQARYHSCLSNNCFSRLNQLKALLLYELHLPVHCTMSGLQYCNGHKEDV